MAKLVALLCLFLVAYASCNPISPEEAGILDALAKKADQLKDGIAEVIKKAVEAIELKAREAIKSAKKFLQELGDKAETLATDLFLNVNGALDKVDLKIEELTGRAPGVDVTECTEMAAELHEAARQVIEGGKRCIAERVEEGSSFVEEIVSVADEFIQDLRAIQANAVSCAEGTNTDTTGYIKILACLAKAAKNAYSAASSHVPVFMKRVTELVAFLHLAGPSMAECTVSNTINTFLSSTEGVMTRIESCIEQKIAESNYEAAIAA